MKLFYPLGLGLLQVTGCYQDGFEEFNRNHMRKQAAIYETSSGSNLKEKPLSGLKFGIVLVDMQEGFFERGFYPYEKSEMLREQKRVLEAAKEYDLPVLVFEMEGFGETLAPLEELIQQVPKHTTFSKYRQDGFEIYGHLQSPNPEVFPSDWLKEQGVNALYFMGINGNACVYETANSAQDLYNFTIATSNEVIATANDNAESGDCHSESCDEAKSGLVLFLQRGILHPKNEPFLDYFKRKEKD